jgi:hypothetical protein
MNYVHLLADSIKDAGLKFSLGPAEMPAPMRRLLPAYRIIAYNVSNVGWVAFEKALKMVCHHEIDNARPVFPVSGQPYIRTRRDNELSNNLSIKKTV